MTSQPRPRNTLFWKNSVKKPRNQRVLWFEATFHLTQMKERYSKPSKNQKSRTRVCRGRKGEHGFWWNEFPLPRFFLLRWLFVCLLALLIIFYVSDFNRKPADFSWGQLVNPLSSRADRGGNGRTILGRDHWNLTHLVAKIWIDESAQVLISRLDWRNWH